MPGSSQPASAAFSLAAFARAYTPGQLLRAAFSRPAPLARGQARPALHHVHGASP
ncbi:hypothetical protein PR002_g2204 [Phytophthora rubi]|uniref:Uncharacterized protein n=1 Tax=Phytophthora rubi TaxID=129364 RepID=A0A6A3NWF7_9STRA|nr:hypothetical protein PR002_g2204 [Phytophthora rubi]